MENSNIIIKDIVNTSAEKIFVGDVLLYELNSLEEAGLDPKNCGLFRSGRMKNDLPSVCRFGKFNDAMRDCIGEVKESGDGKDDCDGNIIVSDHLTILGNDEKALMIAFSGGEHHLVRTEINVDSDGNFVSLKTFAEFNCYLNPNEKRTTEKLEVFITENVSNSIKKWATYRVKKYDVHTLKCPSVYCTWYYYERTVTMEDVRINLQKIKEKNLPFTVFQIDDGWEILPGEWLPADKFPSDMKAVADEIKAYGLTAGIWTCPFVAHEQSSVWKAHPDWILRDTSGNPSIYNVNGTDHFIFDITIEETWNYFEELYRHLTFDWGYTYHKLDFTRAPVIAENAVFANQNLTIIECYRSAVKAIRRGMGDESFFLMCGGLYDPLIGIVDAQRAGSDVLSMWSKTVNKNGKTLPYTVKQSLLRYYMNNWWYNDPDALVIRKNETMERGTRLTYGLLTDDEVKTCTINQLLGGGLVCSTEPLDKIDDERLANLNHILPIRNVEIEIVDLMNTDRYPERIRIKEKNNPNSVYFVIINWDDNNSISPKIKMNEIAGNYLELFEEKIYFVCDFYAKKIYEKLNKNSEIILEKIPSHASTILKLSVDDGQDKKINYDGHYLI